MGGETISPIWLEEALQKVWTSAPGQGEDQSRDLFWSAVVETFADVNTEDLRRKRKNHTAFAVLRPMVEQTLRRQGSTRRWGTWMRALLKLLWEEYELPETLPWQPDGVTVLDQVFGDADEEEEPEESSPEVPVQARQTEGKVESLLQAVLAGQARAAEDQITVLRRLTELEKVRAATNIDLTPGAAPGADRAPGARGAGQGRGGGEVNEPSRSNPDRGTGAFRDLDVRGGAGEPAGSEEQRRAAALDARFAAERPGGRRREVVRWAEPPSRESREPSESRERREYPNETREPRRPTAEETQRELLEALLKREVRRSDAPSNASNVPLWKCAGAQGRVNQDRLEEAMGTRGGVEDVIREFDAATVRMSSLVMIDGEDGAAPERVPMSELVTLWRNNAPLRDNRSLVRVSEGLLRILACLRGGQPRAAEARVLLLLAAIDQAGADKGKWARAQLIASLPEPPFNQYPAAPTNTGDDLFGGEAAGKDKAQQEKLGPLTQWCSRERATVALAVLRDRAGLTR